ncbi:deoxyribodipyrimidine photo-lyase, partial [bacterium]|nr:deoxyribodipyrimidine photo-lyase [bacterium]
MTPTLLWFRRDLRLQDHAALTAALARGGPVIAVFICDAQVETLGSAPKWRLGQGIAALQKAVADKGNRLILRRGAAIDVIPKLVEETGATAVYWQRSYDPASQARDAEVKAFLSAMGLEAKSFKGHLLFEPWTVQTKLGGFYKVYTPLWKAVRCREVPEPLPAPTRIPGPGTYPSSEALGVWGLGRAMQRGAAIVERYARVGADLAQERLAEFTSGALRHYGEGRDIPGEDGTSKLAENLALGE